MISGGCLTSSTFNVFNVSNLIQTHLKWVAEFMENVKQTKCSLDASLRSFSMVFDEEHNMIHIMYVSKHGALWARVSFKGS